MVLGCRADEQEGRQRKTWQDQVFETGHVKSRVCMRRNMNVNNPCVLIPAEKWTDDQLVKRVM